MRKKNTFRSREHQFWLRNHKIIIFAGCFIGILFVRRWQDVIVFSAAMFAGIGIGYGQYIRAIKKK